MGIDLNKGYEELLPHIEHNIVIVTYGGLGNREDPDNIAIECETCGEVLLDFNKPEWVCQECGAAYDEDQEQCVLCGSEEVLEND